MVSVKFARVGCVAVLAALLCPAASFAQSAIAGVVTDTTGAVLPGVAVEATSPVLIEQARTVVSDANGRYRIEELRPGAYKVTFTLPGFSTFVREGITLESDFTAAINAQMRVGGLEETITVSGASPVVDVQSTMSRTVLSREQIEALPSGRSYQSLAATIPALGSALAGRFDVGGTTQMWQGTVVAYGSLSGDMSIEVDGMNVSSLLSSGQISGLYHNQGAYQEMSYQVVAGSAESQTGGVRINMIPKEGGNRFAGDAVVTYSNRHLQSENNDDDLKSRGLVVPPNLYEVRDYNVSLGGPIRRDRVWFFFSPRVWGASNYILNQFFPDGTPARDRSKLQSYTTRFTFQLTSKNKVTALYDPLPKYRDYFQSETGLYTLEGTGVQDMYSHAIQAKWTSTPTNRLLVEAGYSENYTGYQIAFQQNVAGPSASNPWGDIAKSDVSIQSRTFFNAAAQVFENPFKAKQVVASVSYVTGSHSLRIGVQDKFGWIKADRRNHGNLVQVYTNGAPFAVSLQNLPIVSRSDLNADLGIYVQDSWRLGRLTLNPGLRFERFNAEVTEQSAPAGRFVAARHFDRIPNLPNFNNWVPRIGAAYDVFGDGKTGMKASVGRYMQQDASAFPERYNPMTLVPSQVGWTDLNRDDIADGALGCVYLTPGCEINFAQLPTTFGVRRNRNPDPDLSRPYQMVYNIGVTHELRPGFGVSANYYRRRFHDITFTTDLAKPISVYTPFQIPDPRGNGQTMTLYNINPAALRSINELDTTSPNNTSTFNSVDFGFNARLANGAILSGGTATGRIRSVDCDVTDPNSTRFCDESQFDIPWRTTFKVSGTYPLPYGVRLSGVFQSTAGDRFNQTYFVSAATFRSLTGVALGQSSVTLRPLNEPGSLYYDRINQLDFTIAKAFTRGRVRVTPDISLFNLFNANPVYSQTTAYPAVGRPLRILEGRLIRFGVQARF
jgi:hypothetical protein